METGAVLEEALRLLRCPMCAAGLAPFGAVVRCERGHAFDVARQGYVSLLPGGQPAHTGDTAAMVAARERFLGAGHFEPLAAALADALAEPLAEPLADPPAKPGEASAGRPRFVDLGAGTGWYLARALDRDPEALGLALDVSKPALRRAARAHERLAAVACDVWRELPLRDGVATRLLNVFAPRNGAEMARVLAPDGVALIVTPTERHLHELVEPLGLLSVDERKEGRLTEQLAPHLAGFDRRELEWAMSLSQAAVADLAAMGPSAFHVDAAELEARIASLANPVAVTASVTISAARPRAGRRPA